MGKAVHPDRELWMREELVAALDNDVMKSLTVDFDVRIAEVPGASIGRQRISFGAEYRRPSLDLALDLSKCHAGRDCSSSEAKIVATAFTPGSVSISLGARREVRPYGAMSPPTQTRRIH